MIEMLLAFRLGFALAGANRSNGFVEFIYDASNLFVSPFKGIVDHQTSGKMVFEPETVIDDGCLGRRRVDYRCSGEHFGGCAGADTGSSRYAGTSVSLRPKQLVRRGVWDDVPRRDSVIAKASRLQPAVSASTQ